MSSVKPHRKLKLWNEGISFCNDIYKCTVDFPSSEKFALSSQLQRASVSIPANIAEGAARKTKKEFLQFLYIARGSVAEIDTLLELVLQQNYINKNKYDSLNQKLEEISKMLNGLMNSIQS